MKRSWNFNACSGDGSMLIHGSILLTPKRFQLLHHDGARSISSSIRVAHMGTGTGIKQSSPSNDLESMPPEKHPSTEAHGNKTNITFVQIFHKENEKHIYVRISRLNTSREQGREFVGCAVLRIKAFAEDLFLHTLHTIMRASTRTRIHIHERKPLSCIFLIPFKQQMFCQGPVPSYRSQRHMHAHGHTPWPCICHFSVLHQVSAANCCTCLHHNHQCPHPAHCVCILTCQKP
jgi:hypothetical protein